MSSLVVNNVRKTWIGAKGLSVEAIRDASLRVSSGEFVAINNRVLRWSPQHHG